MTPARTTSPTQQLYQATSPAAKPATHATTDKAGTAGAARGAATSGLGQILDIVV
jgi:hypothetical protein